MPCLRRCTYVVESWLAVHEALSATDPRAIDQAEATLTRLEREAETRGRYWLGDVGLDSRLQEKLVSSVTPATRQFFSLERSAVFAPLRSGRRAEAEKAMQHELRAAYLAQKASVDELIGLAAIVEKEQREAAAASVKQYKHIAAGAAVLGALVALFIGVLTLRNLSRRLGGLVTSLEAAAAGDLSPRPVDDGADEVSAVHASLRLGLGSMAEVIEGMQRVSKQVERESTALASTSSSLQTGVTEHAASSEETSASLEELTANSQQTSTIAQRGNELSTQSSEAVQSTIDVMKATQEAMRTLVTTSNKVEEIVATVDEMSFQTNLLALNAAVEAARAGEAGRGFAVVAHEVRALAQRSAAAARDIRRLIQGSVEHVGESTKLVDKSSNSLEEAGQAVREVAVLMRELATAAREQSTGVEEINRALLASDGVAQRTTSQAQALTQAATRLSSSATSLTQLSSRFLTRGGAAVAVEAPPFEPALATVRPEPSVSAPRAPPPPESPMGQGFAEF